MKRGYTESVLVRLKQEFKTHTDKELYDCASKVGIIAVGDALAGYTPGADEYWQKAKKILKEKKK